MKLKLIELLCLLKEGYLNDGERLIIDNRVYYFNVKDDKFYTVPFSKTQNKYLKINTFDLYTDCELIDRDKNYYIKIYVEICRDEKNTESK